MEFLKKGIWRELLSLTGSEELVRDRRTHLECHSSPVVFHVLKPHGRMGLVFPKSVGSRNGSGGLLEDGELELGLEE